MSVVLSTVSAIQLCAGCAVEFETRVTLGAAEDPTGPGIFAEVLDMGDQGYLVSSEVLGGVVIVYDSEGRYQRELTREGEGPGELRAPPRFASGPGGIILMEPGSANCVPDAPWNSKPGLRWVRPRIPRARGSLRRFSTWGTRDIW